MEMIESKVNYSFQAISNSIISHHYGFKSCIQYKILVSSVDISLINPNLKSIVKLPAVDNPRLIQCLKVSFLVKKFDLKKIANNFCVSRLVKHAMFLYQMRKLSNL